ncbi:extracellular solute-binding protein [Abyssisolibacter fermentans]|uniref:extracellular solute-binding protein n=1 Tax=Abyssisolibacter fermentans TaxID=1766203 RepID=UPI0008356785|nr:extracellular solute-binding protein [Abyssisolibacter fermentans]
MKKILCLILCIVLALLTIGCSNNSDDITIDADSKDEKQREITIVIKDYDLSNIKANYSTIYRYSKKFETENGMKVNFDIINGNNEDDYDKKINTKLYLKEGPTLIYISDYSTYRDYIEQGIAVNTEGRIPNLIKVYDSLLDDGHYFVPVGMLHWATALNRCAVDKLEIDDPKFDWTREDYLKIKEKWLKLEPEYFCAQEYWNLLIFMINDLEILDESNKEASLNNTRVIQYINDVREEIFSGKYIINKDYTYENYYNMIFEKDSEEHKESRDLKRRHDNENLRKDLFGINGLKSLEIADFIDLRDDIVLPNIIYGKDDLLYTCGFIVNKNGKNIELAMEFINGLLSDEIQLEMYKTEADALYPVNKEIVNEIEKIEKDKSTNEKAVDLRKYILQQIKTGNYRRCSNSRVNQEIKNMIYKDFAKFIFADEAYTDEELGSELQKLENKYNMWLNE